MIKCGKLPSFICNIRCEEPNTFDVLFEEADELIPGTFFRQQSAYPDEEKLESGCHSSPLNECRKSGKAISENTFAYRGL
uniref:Uncharacterized protein n=1 Tax=Parascaris equorum TaxID=6256 RepID=A0A914RRD6_PAREQ